MTVAGNFEGSGDKINGPCVSSVMTPGTAGTHVPRYLLNPSTLICISNTQIRGFS